MTQIALDGIRKSFTIAERPEGKFALLRGIFARNKRLIRALDEITFTIDEGELVGYIGPNGAGKSTTVKIMSGILTPDAGSCTILQRTPWRERAAHVANLGVVFGQRSQLWWDVPVCDSFNLLKDIYSIPAADYAQRLAELTEALDIAALVNTPVRQLSLGQRMRCEIAAALLHRPRILFLDEPTIGLDAVSKLALRDFLKAENRKHGVTMILTTHDMNDIESLCNRVMVIGQGKLLFDDRLEVLKTQYAPLRRIRATLTETKTQIPLPGAENIQIEGNTWTVWFDPAKYTAPAIVQHLADKLPLKDIIIEEQDIEEIIATMYREMQL
ncbi:MAG TPA: ATP-binding cassette domain-containing protein [Bacillota bacterium]|nr:ATP-binding cassette domain-containing protein [Bacillota bacterium]